MDRERNEAPTKERKEKRNEGRAERRNEGRAEKRSEGRAEKRNEKQNEGQAGWPVAIREPEREDLPRLLEIYNGEVLHGTATFDLRPKTLPEWETWCAQHNRDHHILLEAVADGRPVGYASLSVYREREAFAGTSELSVYVAPDWRGRGVATALLERVLQRAGEDGRTHAVVSVITQGNEASIRLHQKFGFRFCGALPEVGRKFGRLLGVEHYVLLLSPK